MDPRVRDTQLTGGLGNRLSAGLSEPHRLSLELLRIRLLDFWHDPASPSGIVYPKFSLLHKSEGSSERSCGLGGEISTESEEKRCLKQTKEDFP
jgi:hypothetical protein